jgi:ABC-2 type transport system ATP-binding protein
LGNALYRWYPTVRCDRNSCAAISRLDWPSAASPATEIKAKVSGRTIRATLPGADPALLATLPGVTSAEQHGDAVALSCADSDAALRALLGGFSMAHDIEVLGAGIEEAFLALTGDDVTEGAIR